MKKVTLSNKVKFSYAFGGLGKDMMFAMSTIMLFYFNDLLLINAAFLGIMMMVVRIWDAVNDPIMGSIVDRTRTRFGKFRPWILIGAITNAIVLVFLFINPDFQTGSLMQLVYVTSFYTLWGMTYTLMDIPFWSMIPALSNDQKERESITVLTRLFTSVGYFVVAGGYLTFAQILGGGKNPENQIVGLMYFAIIVSVIFVIAELVVFFNVKEQIVVEEREKRTLKQMFYLLKENDQLLVVMIVVLIINFTLYITSGMAIYYITYNIGNPDLFFLFIAAGGVLQVTGSVLYALLSKYFKRKKIFNIAILIQFVGFVLLFFNAFIIESNVALLFVFSAFVFLGQGIFMVLQTVLLSDTVEYGELKIGKRSEATAFSVQTFVVKLAMGLSSGVIGVGLAIINFMKPVENPDGTISRIIQSDATLLGMSLMMFILPLFGLLFSRYIFNKKHILDEEKYKEVVEKLQAKRGVGSEASE